MVSGKMVCAAWETKGDGILFRGGTNAFIHTRVSFYPSIREDNDVPMGPNWLGSVNEEAEA